MKLAACHEVFLAVCFVIIEIAVRCVAGNLPYDRFQQAYVYRNKNKDNNLAPIFYINETTPRENNELNTYVKSHRAVRAGNYSQDKYKIGYNNEKAFSKTGYGQIKKWQVGRVSRKQYEIINMLWRKTKIFGDEESTSANYLFRQHNHNGTNRSFRYPFMRFSSRPTLPSTTPSFIEFYYLDEADEQIKELPTPKLTPTSTMKEQLIRNLGNHKFVLSDSPMFSFRVHDASYKPPPFTNRYTQVTNKNKRRKPRTRDSSLTGFDSLSSLAYKLSRIRTKAHTFVTNSTASRKFTYSTASSISTTEAIYDNETCPTTTEDMSVVDNNITSATVNLTTTKELESTTIYDKIKFFEMYDKLTPIPYYDEKGRYDMDNVDGFIKGNELDRQVLLEHVDQSLGNEHSQPHKAKPAKKHIIDAYKRESKNQSNANLVLDPKIIAKPTRQNFSNVAHPPVLTPKIAKQPMKKLLLSETKAPQWPKNKDTHNVEWSQYPFAAAYVYEPLRVHCDAAGISPHWLITSGSCLSRHHKNPSGEGRSAFVAYCGVTWWNPERVAYVKYSLVHPRFNLRDKTRRHLYNIGLIQVVNSMASACTGWSSISLMSHQIAADVEGATAYAVGWGLDRFDTRYSSNDLPKSPLASYENKVFSHSCPGNIGYDKAKRLDEEGGIKNVYCLALPPYSGEDTDPVHGGLLLVGGKLVALYLQEERRPWGDQSAQYTGTWRLVPWIHDVARENDDADTFTLDI